MSKEAAAEFGHQINTAIELEKPLDIDDGYWLVPDVVAENPTHPFWAKHGPLEARRYVREFDDRYVGLVWIDPEKGLT